MFQKDGEEIVEYYDRHVAIPVTVYMSRIAAEAHARRRHALIALGERRGNLGEDIANEAEERHAGYARERAERAAAAAERAAGGNAPNNARPRKSRGGARKSRKHRRTRRRRY